MTVLQRWMIAIRSLCGWGILFWASGLSVFAVTGDGDRPSPTSKEP